MKRVLKTIFSLCLLAAAAVSCNRPEPQPPTTTSGSRTIIAYFFGTDLSYYFNINLRDMAKAVEQGDMGENRLLIFLQLDSKNAEIKEMRYDTATGKAVTETLEEITLPATLDAAQAGEYMSKMLNMAPAESYSAIFLGHATAWLPKTPIEAAVTYGLRPRFVPSFEKMPGAEVTRNIGERNVQLDITELSDALTATGVKFDCLYFDVCFMSSLEAAYELRNTAKYIIASPCEIMGNGSPYDTILRPLFTGDYKLVCDEYLSFYEKYTYPSGCIAAIDCSKLEAVAEAVKRINAVPAAEGFDLSKVQAYEGRSNSGRYAGHWFYDAEDYYMQICADQALVDEFIARLLEAVPERRHTASFYSAYNADFNDIHHFSGISLTPDEKCIEAIGESAHRDMLEYYNPSLRQTAWYKATH